MPDFVWTEHQFSLPNRRVLELKFLSNVLEDFRDSDRVRPPKEPREQAGLLD